MKVICYELKQTITKRKYEISQKEFANFLKKHLTITRKQIAETLDIPFTEVEHWFRTDKYGSLPNHKHWQKVKEILNITETKYDSAITEFIEQDGVFETAERCYGNKGISPTITCLMNQRVIKRYATISKTSHK